MCFNKTHCSLMCNSTEVCNIFTFTGTAVCLFLLSLSLSFQGFNGSSKCKQIAKLNSSLNYSELWLQPSQKKFDTTKSRSLQVSVLFSPHIFQLCFGIFISVRFFYQCSCQPQHRFHFLLLARALFIFRIFILKASISFQ